MGDNSDEVEGIVSWKDFPRMVNENIPVYMDEYKKWLEQTAKIREE